MTKYWTSVTKGLDPYVPGEQPKIEGLIKLNTNENPYGPSPRVVDALVGQAGDSMRLYPDPNSDLLREEIATLYNIAMEQVFVGNGSDEVLAHTFLALFKHSSPLLFPDITYSFYPVYCGLYDIDYVEIPLGDEFEISVDDYMRQNGGIIFANPNAPTGKFLELEEIERLLSNNQESVVVVDEAYVDFGGQSAVGLIDKYDNLLVIHTLSKSRSLAGLRVGFAMGDGSLISALDRVKNSFNSYPLSRFAIAGGAAAVADRKYFTTICERIIASRTLLSKQLEELGFDVLPSMANFVFARNEKMDAARLSMALRERNILVRHFSKPRIDQFLRITIGTEEQCAQLVQALEEILS